MQATQAGIILGTAAYMSPEQARGDETDNRSDVWALGVVLFEMLAGRQAFEAQTLSDVLAHVLAREPDCPRPVVKLLRRCLEKNRCRRLAGASEVIVAIEELLTRGEDDEAPEARIAGGLTGRQKMIGAGAAAALAILALPWSPGL